MEQNRQRHTAVISAKNLIQKKYAMAVSMSIMHDAIIVKPIFQETNYLTRIPLALRHDVHAVINAGLRLYISGRT